MAVKRSEPRNALRWRNTKCFLGSAYCNGIVSGLPTIRTTLNNSPWTCIGNQDEQLSCREGHRRRELSTTNLGKRRSACLVKANTVEKVRKTRVAPHRIEVGRYFDPLQDG